MYAWSKIGIKAISSENKTVQIMWTVFPAWIPVHSLH